MSSTCPRCGSVVAEIVYGLPSEEMSEAADRGEILLGGCVVDPRSPTWQCIACGHSGGAIRPTRTQVIAEAYQEWADEWVDKIAIITAYESEPEAALLMNASPEAEADLERRTRRALRAAGLAEDG